MKLRFWERPKFYGCRITLEQLEERIVLDAAGGASQQTEDQQQDTTHQTVADAQQTAAQTTTAQAPAPVGSVTPPGQAASQSPQQTDNLAKVIPHNDLNVVLVSNDIQEIKGISDAAIHGAKVIVYDAQDDNLTSLSAMLDQLVQSSGQKIDNLAVVGHGSADMLTIGSDQINFFNVSQYSAVLKTIGTDLAANAQIQFFGCSVAGDAFGQALVDKIATFTGADVFASTNVTGGTWHDWVLEYSSDSSAKIDTVLDTAALASTQSEALVGSLPGDASGWWIPLDIYPGGDAIDPSNPPYTIDIGGIIYFVATDGAANHGRELWKTDGTAAGTVRLTDLKAGGADSNPHDLVDLGGYLYFVADSDSFGTQIWKYNGSSVEQVTEMIGGGSQNSLTVMGSNLYFAASYGLSGMELWKTTGAYGAESQVAEINGGGDANPHALKVVGTNLYFVADDGSHGQELWKYDGTTASMIVVEGTGLDINPGSASAFGSGGSVPDFQTVGGTLFFAAEDATYGNELWKINASGNAELVKDINSGTGQGVAYMYGGVHTMASLGGELYFAGNDGTNGWELWQSDGTSSGTTAMVDSSSHSVGTPNYFASTGTKVFFSANDGTHGTEPWVTDGTSGGTFMLTDTQTGSVGGFYKGFGVAGSVVIFSADDGSHGIEPWRSDGTTAGTFMRTDLNPGSASSYPGGGVWDSASSTLYVAASDGAGNHGGEMLAWRNSAPTINVVTPTAVDEGGTPDLSMSISVTDDPHDTLTVVLTAWAGYDSISLTAVGAATVTHNYASTEWQIVGTMDDVNDTLATLAGMLTPDYYGSATIEVTCHDAQPLSATPTNVNLTVNRVNEAPFTQDWIATGLEDNVIVLNKWPFDDSTDSTHVYKVGGFSELEGYAIAFNNCLYFTAGDGIHGIELWKADNVTGRTSMVDINPGAAGSMPGGFALFNGDLYFQANDGSHGTELWKVSGATGVASMVQDLVTGSDSGYPANFIVYNSDLYFSAHDPTNGTELWKLDHTSGVAAIVQDINPGIGDSLPSEPYFTVFNGELYFSADDGTYGQQLWKLDASDNLTMLTDITTGFGGTWPAWLTVFNGELYFSAYDDTNGTELWKSDGSYAGTAMVMDINPVGESGPSDLVVFNNDLYFSADDSVHGSELWKVDHLTGTPVLAQDINTTADSNPGHLTVFNNDLYFTANDGTHGIELWKFDHTTLTASMVRDLNPGTGDGCYGNMVVFNNDLYFSGDDGTHGQELWKLDHLTGYTFMAKDVGGGTGNGLLVAVNDHLYFSASNDPLGLWAIGPGGSNPDNAAYVKIVDLPANGTLKYMSNPVSAGDSIPWAAAATGMLTFVPNADWNGATSFHFQVIDDGAPANGPDITSLQSTMTINVTPVNDSPVIETPWAQVIKDISPSGTADVTGVELGGYVYFRAYDASHGWELWRTDGTPYGTTLVSDINPAGDSWVYNFAVHNGIIYFSADDGTHGYELWRSDGTPAGTWMVKDINSSGSDSSAPSNLTSAGGILFFSADDGSGDELWKSDGTSAGTVMVKDINGASGSGIGWMTTFGTGVLFSADDGSGSELWKSDGTSAGTVMVNPAGADTDPTHITVMGGWAYYMASSPSEGYELWRSNGITTELVKDVNTSGDGLDTTPNQSFVAIGGILYFLANDGSGAGTELWRSDGSAPGTVMVEDILPTAGMSSGVHDLFNFNGCLYFSANDGVHGFELWKSDSTAAGTYLFADIIAGADSSGPHNFHATGSELFFLADPVAGFTTVYRTNGTSAPEAAGLIIPGGSIPDIVATSNNYALVKSPGEGTGFDNVLWRLDAGMHDTYVNKDTDLRFGYGSYDRIRISDPDATGDMQVQLTASNGTITLQDITGLNFSFSDGAGTGMGDGDHDALLCFRGSLTDVQTALDHMIFTPTTGFTGTTSINVQANDLDGAPISNGMFNIQVYPDNFAPVLDNTGTMNLTSITAEQTTNGGNTVASIIASAGGDRITDLNSDPEGIAITATTQTYGTWEYSIDGGTSWTAVGAVDSMNALLLRAADYVRFAADGTHSETATISFHAWDRTSWSGGDKVNASVTGGETPFSVGIEDATMHVAPITGLTIEKYAADGETNDDFGFSVAVSGDWAIVGVECDDNVNGTDAGAAYIYHWNGSAWAEQQMLIASDGAAGDCFGVSVAISGNYAIVGASSGDGAVADSGAAYIYHWNGATWGEEQKVTTPGGAYEDFYGATVAISGDYAIVGANAADGAAADSGAAFIYHRTGSTWGEEQMVTASDGATNDYFGCSVAISGDYAIVGAYAADGAEADSGAAYVYHWNGVTWGEEQKITASDATLGDVLGQTVAISGSYAVVGAPCADVTVSDTGAAYIYHWNGISWDQQKKITAPDGEDGLGFGDSVAISGDSLIVGAYHDTVGANTDQGSAYVFSRTMGGTDNWGLVEKVTASDGAANDFFGTGVGISGTTYLVGAAYGDGVVADTGSIYFSGTFTNSAPVLDPSGTMNLTWITSEQTTNSGNTVAEIIASAGGDRITDADIGALEGIAITATAQTYGFWEYSTNGGSIWNPVGFVDDAQALLLRATDYVRFSPDGIHAGDGTISFYAWDQTSGAFGTKVDTGVTGGSSAFSVASETAAIDVVPITELGHKIFAADGNTGDYYGYSVSMFGDWAAVGSQGDNGFTGSAHIYYRDQGGSNNWGWVKDVTASDGAASDYFGISVAGGGDWLVVGACQDDVGANTDQGSVYIFNRNEGGANNWGEVTADHLFAPAGAAWDNFGNSVAISGDYIVVGAYCDNSQQGSAYIYHWDMSNWVYVKQITASDGASTDQFGISVSISGDDVIVGSWMDDVGANTDQGSAYIFHFYVNTSVFRLSGGGTFCDK